MSDFFNVGFDPGSLERIAKIEGFKALLNPEIQKALVQGGSMLVTTAQTNTWVVFDHPSGRLASTIFFYVVSPSEVAIAVGSPYGRRRERGFSGMTDSIGRYFAHDPGKPYLAPAVESDKGMISAFVGNAVYNAWGGIL